MASGLSRIVPASPTGTGILARFETTDEKLVALAELFCDAYTWRNEEVGEMKKFADRIARVERLLIERANKQTED